MATYSERLVQHIRRTVRASEGYALGRGSTGAAASLAELAMRGIAWSRSFVWAGVVSATFVVAGAGTLALQTLAGKPTESEQPTANAPEQTRQSEAREDQYGDPLPPGAIARLGTVRMGDVQGCLVFSPDGKLLACATGSARNCITLWDAATGRAVRRIDNSDPLSHLAFSPDGKRLACSARRCRVIEVASGKELYTVAGSSGAFSGDGKMLVTSGTLATGGSQGHVWDAATGRQIREWTNEKGVRGGLAAVGGRYLAIFNWDTRRDVDICDIEKDE